MADASRLTRPDRRAVLGGLLVGATAASAPVTWARAEEKEQPPPTSIERIEIDARPIAHFERNRPEVKRFGALEFRGGMVLTSPSDDFGGWSALVMDPAGKSMLAISDVGSWLSADLVYDGSRPSGLTNARLGPLLDTDGRPLERKVEQDAEVGGAGERHLAERHAADRFRAPPPHRPLSDPRRRGAGADGHLEAPRRGQAHAGQSGHRGPGDPQGRPLQGLGRGLAERFTRGSGYHTGWIWVGSGEPQRFQLQDIDGFNITDAAALPDGSLLVLERYFRWTEGVKMRLRHIPASEIAPGARITGRTLIQADSNYDIDNMEGLAVHGGAAGETVLSMISDDNFNHLIQRTVFLQFTLHDVD